MKEETRLDLVEEPIWIFTRYDGSCVTVTFLCKVSGEIHTEEAGVVAWVDRETLVQCPFSEYNKNLFEIYGKYWKNSNV